MRKIGDILLDRDLITKEQLNKALNKQNISKKYLGQILLEIGAITEDVLTDIQASLLGLSVISTDSLKIHPKIIKFIPRSIAIKYRLIPIYIEPNNNKNTLCMVTSEEPPSSILNKMSEKLNIPIKLLLATYSELEILLVEHYDKKEEVLILEDATVIKQVPVSKPLTSKPSLSPIKVDNEKKNDFKLEIDEEDEGLLSGDLIEEDLIEEELIEEELIEEEIIEEELILSGDLIDDESDDIQVNLDLDDEVTKDNSENDEMSKTKVNKPLESLDIFDDLLGETIPDKGAIPNKISEDVVLDLFDIDEASIKIESEDNIPTLTIDRTTLNSEVTKKPIVEKKESKKLNFLEAFKSEDDDITENLETFDQSEDDIYVKVDLDDNLDLDLDLIEDIEVEEVEEDKSDDFPFALDDLVSSDLPKKQPNKPSPPPLSSKSFKPSIPIKPKKENTNPQNVDKSGFPSPDIKKFKEESDETNPSITQKISLNEKKESDEWLKNNKNRDIPDLDSIFNSDDVLDPLDNKNIDKIILSKKISNISDELINFLKSKKVNNKNINKFKSFFKDLENNPANLILVSMLELLLIEEKPNIDLFFDIILKNINNVNS